MDVESESLKRALQLADILNEGCVRRRGFAQAWTSMHESATGGDLRAIHKHIDLVEKGMNEKLDRILNHLGLPTESSPGQVATWKGFKAVLTIEEEDGHCQEIGGDPEQVAHRPEGP